MLASLGGRAGPTLLLAALLPTVLFVCSRSLRRSPLFPAWALTVAPAVAALGAISSRTHLAWAPPLLALAALGAAGYAVRRPRQAGVALPLAVLGGAAMLVAFYSSAQGGPGPMEAWYERYGISKETAYALTIAFRKTVHFTFYGTVGLAALIAARRAGADGREALRVAFVAALTVASCDELRQSAYANRSGSAWDVLLDLSGAAAFVGLSEWRRAKSGSGGTEAR